MTMNKKWRLAASLATMMAFVAAATSAFEIDVYYQDGPQDTLSVPQIVHELGVGFEAEELISSADMGTTSLSPCPENDNPDILNVVVSITNNSGLNWTHLWYVADPETLLTNHDGWVRNAGSYPADYQLAFRIDSVGVNTPLVSESTSLDGVFQPGETWEFIIQDYQNSFQGPPHRFASWGIAADSQGCSSTFLQSTGSIIAYYESAAPPQKTKHGKTETYPNSVNLGSNGVVPVAILSNADFDATSVDPETVFLAGAGVAVKGKGSKSLAHEEDVNDDGLTDLVCQVKTENLDPEGFQDGLASVTGETFDGVPVEGWDEITIVPPE
jgi:hypothetical protein